MLHAQGGPLIRTYIFVMVTAWFIPYVWGRLSQGGLRNSGKEKPSTIRIIKTSSTVLAT